MPRYHRALRPRRLAKVAPLCLGALFFLTGATRIGYQDIASLMAQQPHVAERARERIFGASRGAFFATFSFARPLGTHGAEVDVNQIARFDASGNPSGVNRLGKGDLQVPRIQIQILAELLKEDSQALEPENDDAKNIEASLDWKPFDRYDPAMVLDPNQHAQPEAVASADSESPEAREEQRLVYFSAAPTLASVGGLEGWGAEGAPIIEGIPAVAVATATPAAEPAILRIPDNEPSITARPLQSPADRLKLVGLGRAKAEKCLATAIYFEARSEPVRGQVAVAQVIINRAFSGYYPDDICGVVYQNKHRHLSCQFTFACDGIPDVVTEPEHWARAQRIATASLDGKVWLDDVGLATHYHASYVYPYWVRSMRKLKKIGLHTFYRPRKWGEDAAPTWTSDEAAALLAKM
ncbi:spore cortex-lytic enzyme precursor [Variibacter gotjawalensis]|uniref:Spore cortex-lytic enzyme n=1 Tax=Variibacter gotjawalensis TaxID=1333996 RepID=A0A0S3PQR3_9BRAD|nr:cell wall hydrolase [Variibacter gotjawalensis]NIK48579.1 hypothetical protein [Variibacter gotjawalensis]RZS50444.1 cell wall hydrolase [Variibacter gotjawalensis]BAT58278.1 spore cortex-lytic enzyme precursor [Variibacter gotjawalensis]